MIRPTEYRVGGVYVVHSPDGRHVLEGHIVTIHSMISGVVPYIRSLSGSGETTLCGKNNLYLPDRNRDYKILLRR